MARKAKKDDGPQVTWLSSYADMMSLLLCFFVLLYSMSDINAVKFQKVISSFSSSGGIKMSSNSGSGINNMLGSGITQIPNNIGNYDSIKENLNNMGSDFKTYFAENNLNEQVKVEQGENYIKLVFNDILFDKGSADIKDNIIPILDKIANEINNAENMDIRIEGHTDSDPINTPLFRNNWYLSAARAISVGNYFISEKGIAPSKIGTEGFGEYRPIAPNDTNENKAKNRRVEIKIMSNVNNN